MFFGIFKSADEKADEIIAPLQPILEKAVLNNDFGLVKTILAKSVPGSGDKTYRINPNLKPANNASLLHITAFKNHVETAGLLINAGAKIDTNDSNDGIMPLHTTARYGSVAVAKLLLENGADINAQTNEGLTPLHRAIIFNQTSIAEFLVTAGARKDICDKDGETPLDIAIKKKFHHFTEILGGIPAKPKNQVAMDTAAQWEKIDPQSISRTRHIQSAGMALTEIFDFVARERVTLTKGDSAISAPNRQKFDDISEKAPLEEALKKLLEMGGTPDPKSIIMSPRKMEKLPGIKS